MLGQFLHSENPRPHKDEPSHSEIECTSLSRSAPPPNLQTSTLDQRTILTLAVAVASIAVQTLVLGRIRYDFYFTNVIPWDWKAVVDLLNRVVVCFGSR